MLTALGAGVCGTVFALVLLLWPSPSREEGAAKEGAKTVAGCHGESCTGRDPVRMLCGAGKAPRTLRTVRVSGRLLDIRFQRECGAAWVRMWGQKVGDRVEVRVPGTAPQVETIDDGYETGQRRSTPMVPVQARDAEPVRACLVPREGERTCFVAHV
jgi:hypothetical protein